jgi:hypothetical protein
LAEKRYGKRQLEGIMVNTKKIILVNMNLKKQGVRVRIGFNWLRVRSNGGLLGTMY